MICPFTVKEVAVALCCKRDEVLISFVCVFGKKAILFAVTVGSVCMFETMFAVATLTYASMSASLTGIKDLYPKFVFDIFVFFLNL